MFDRRLALTSAALILVASLSFALSRVPGNTEIAPIAESVAGIKIPSGPSQQASSEEFDYAYLLKEHEGRVAVFPAGKDEPELVLDVLVKYLPDYDRQQMKDGVRVKDYNELVALIEDYVS